MIPRVFLPACSWQAELLSLSNLHFWEHLSLLPLCAWSSSFPSGCLCILLFTMAGYAYNFLGAAVCLPWQQQMGIPRLCQCGGISMTSSSLSSQQWPACWFAFSSGDRNRQTCVACALARAGNSMPSLSLSSCSAHCATVLFSSFLTPCLLPPPSLPFSFPLSLCPYYHSSLPRRRWVGQTAYYWRHEQMSILLWRRKGLL